MVLLYWNEEKRAIIFTECVKKKKSQGFKEQEKI